MVTDMDALASAAVQDVRDDMTVGLGTGRAATRAIHALARRATEERLKLHCVATSRASEELARALGLLIRDMQAVERVDYLSDGADEVDESLRMLKGRGGAMTREKIVAQASARRVYLIQSRKRVGHLGETVELIASGPALAGGDQPCHGIRRFSLRSGTRFTWSMKARSLGRTSRRPEW
jgi:ribose 5-phosphate isomerase A